MHNPENKEGLLYVSDILAPEKLIFITIYYVQWVPYRYNN